MVSSGPFSCPFCEFVASDSYAITLHVEEHVEDSPFVARAESPDPLAVALQEEENRLAAAPSKHPKRSPSSKTIPVSKADDNASLALALQLQGEEQARGTRVRDQRTVPDDEEFPYVECPECSEFIVLTDFNDHVDLHAASHVATEIDPSETVAGSTKNTGPKRLSMRDQGLPSVSFERSKTSAVDQPSGDVIARSIGGFLRAPSTKTPSTSSVSKGNRTGRLGRRELGPHAYEEMMPSWLYEQLRTAGRTRVRKIGSDGRLHTEWASAENEVGGLVPVLSRLSMLTKSMKVVYCCHPSVHHVSKMKREGGFCGYRNVQMMYSYMQSALVDGRRRFGDTVPGVLQLQDMIERAWDQGIHPNGRTETGGVKGTRKWIGTPEALTILEYLQVAVDVRQFNTAPTSTACTQLLDWVEGYFQHSNCFNPGMKTQQTQLSPIYLQQPGHSLTVVGLERHTSGARSLLVFDPSFAPPNTMRNLAERQNNKLVSTKSAEAMMKIYRRDISQLAKHDSYEALV
ncbi:hypothetical protein H2203_002496 [Taxawa tesnikishii (nom. ined.)]|nr:hypothetical protein H2203_002496 [Dothideales sp. JES 119]